LSSAHDEDRTPADSTRGFVFAAVVLLAGFALAWLAQSGIPGLGGFATVWPQRWTFFTGLDRTSVVAYRQAEAREPLSPLEELGPNNLDRSAEVRFAEMKQIALKVPDAHWQACARQYPADCGLDLDADNVLRMKNESPGSHLCGRIALAVERTEQPPPGALPISPTRARRVALVDLECAH
jgi:hypothetical protein